MEATDCQKLEDTLKIQKEDPRYNSNIKKRKT